jgi:hypothetical protein
MSTGKGTDSAGTNHLPTEITLAETGTETGTGPPGTEITPTPTGTYSMVLEKIHHRCDHCHIIPSRKGPANIL